MPGNEKLIGLVMFFKPFIIAAGFSLILVLSFLAGGRYSCKAGYMSGLTCVTPQTLGVVKLCELKNDCREICANVQVNDIPALEKALNVTLGYN